MSEEKKKTVHIRASVCSIQFYIYERHKRKCVAMQQHTHAHARTHRNPHKRQKTDEPCPGIRTRVCACNVMSVLITHTRAYIWLIEYPVFQSSLAPPQSTLRSRLSLRGSRRGDVQFRACVRARASLDVIRIASAIIVDAFMCRAYYSVTNFELLNSF